ncbi:hypothetical protein DA469_21310 [Bacillus subtilis]|nr:hypothetical protein DA469_21310 [Bacillus subtilis]
MGKDITLEALENLVKELNDANIFGKLRPIVIDDTNRTLRHKGSNYQLGDQEKNNSYYIDIRELKRDIEILIGFTSNLAEEFGQEMDYVNFERVDGDCNRLKAIGKALEGFRNTSVPVVIFEKEMNQYYPQVNFNFDLINEYYEIYLEREKRVIDEMLKEQRRKEKCLLRFKTFAKGKSK